MADETPAAPAEAPQAPESVADTSTNSNPAPAPDMHGFTSEDLAGMRTFIDNNGGWDKIKSRISNPTQAAESAQPQRSEQPTSQSVEKGQPQQQEQAQEEKLPDGVYSFKEIQMKRFFDDISKDPKYANISEQIKNGDVLKEMASMGMHPIDNNFNVDMRTLNKFLELKSASVPTRPTSSEPNNTPTVDYIQVGENITDMNQALAVYDQSMKAQAKGLPAHPAFEQAKKYISSNWGKK